MARSKFKGNGDKRVGGAFVALPNVMIDSPGYRQAGHTARSLLVDMARQYTGHNNGKLVACPRYLRPLGWKSNQTITRALRELVACGLLAETRKGARPNKAAWFALTWLDLDQGQGLDINANLYRRGDYMTPETGSVPSAGANARTQRATAARIAAARAISAAKAGTSLKPLHGVGDELIAPSRGVSPSIPAPWDGAVCVQLGAPSTPLDGPYVEVPSPRPVAGRDVPCLG